MEVTPSKISKLARLRWFTLTCKLGCTGLQRYLLPGQVMQLAAGIPVFAVTLDACHRPDAWWHGGWREKDMRFRIPCITDPVMRAATRLLYRGHAGHSRRRRWCSLTIGARPSRLPSVGHIGSK
jgi:hypothetical protein